MPWSEAFAEALTAPERAVPPLFAPGDAERRFAVYRNNVAVGLIDALAANFPVVARLVGDAFFAAMALEFIRASQPRTPMLFEYGAGFAEFIAAFPPAGDLPYLPDVARLERMWLDAYHAEEADPLGVAALGALPPDALLNARLVLHPSLHILGSDHPVVSIWRAHRGESEPVVDDWRPERVLVLRPQAEVLVHATGAAAASFVAALRDGADLGAAARAALAVDDGFDLGGALVELISLGGVAALIPPTKEP